MESILIDPDGMESVLQECLDSLAAIHETVIKTENVNLIMNVGGHVFTIGTMLKMLADEMGLDVNVSTPTDG